MPFPGELLKYRAKDLGISARTLLPDDQRRMTFLNRENCPFASQLLSGCPLPSVHFTPTFLRLAIQSISLVPLATLAHISGSTSKTHNDPKMPQRTFMPTEETSPLSPAPSATTADPSTNTCSSS